MGALTFVIFLNLINEIECYCRGLPPAPVKLHCSVQNSRTVCHDVKP
ncbi:hypothetical protein VCRA2110O2_30016 [Vibrio crassostreae]|nr:hypothetical protein VCRA2110O2_30016 [Vibrio crassostreae]